MCDDLRRNGDREGRMKYGMQTVLTAAICLFISLASYGQPQQPQQDGQPQPPSIHIRPVPVEITDALKKGCAEVARRYPLSESDRATVQTLVASVPSPTKPGSMLPKDSDRVFGEIKEQMNELGFGVVAVFCEILQTSQDDDMREKALEMYGAMHESSDAKWKATKRSVYVPLECLLAYDRDVHIRAGVPISLYFLLARPGTKEPPKLLLDTLWRMYEQDPHPAVRRSAGEQLKRLHLLPLEPGETLYEY